MQELISATVVRECIFLLLKCMVFFVYLSERYKT